MCTTCTRRSASMAWKLSKAGASPDASAFSRLDPTTPTTFTPSRRSASRWTRPMKPVPTMAAPMDVTPPIMASAAVEIPVAPGVGATAPIRRQIVAARLAGAPSHRVGDHVLHLGLVVDRELLVGRPEVEDATRSAGVAESAPKHLPARERA